MKYMLNCCTTIFRFINLDLGEIQWRSSWHLYITDCFHKHYVYYLSIIFVYKTSYTVNWLLLKMVQVVEIPPC